MVYIYILDVLIIGLLLLGVTLGSAWITLLLLSFALIYLLMSIVLGYEGLGMIQLIENNVFNAKVLDGLTEFVVIVSVFSCGLKIIHPLRWQVWQITDPHTTMSKLEDNA